MLTHTLVVMIVEIASLEAEIDLLNSVIGIISLFTVSVSCSSLRPHMLKPSGVYHVHIDL